MTKIFNNVTFDSDANACYITVTNDVVVETLESQKDCWIDIDDKGNVVGIEILNVNLHYPLINSILLSQKPVKECVSY